jgi:DNA-binding transcriptional regulator YhcF (GntR family)
MTLIEIIPIIISVLFLGLFIYYLIAKSDSKSEKKFTSDDIDIIQSKKIANIDFNEKITTIRLINDDLFFSNTIYKLRSNLDRAFADPYEIESIIEILIENMFQDSKSVKDFLFPLYNHLCEFESATYTHFIGSIFEKIAKKPSISLEELGGQITLNGSEKLKKTLFLHFTKSNLNYSSIKDLVLELIDDESIIEEYSDILAISYIKDPSRIINLFNAITPRYHLLNIGNLSDKKEQSVLRLTIFFFVKILIDTKAKIENIEHIKRLFFNKYKIIFTSIFENKQNLISKKIRSKVYEILEDTGFQQWHRGIGNVETGRQINNFFFVEYNKANGSQKIQRDQLHDFFKYFIQLSNDSFDDKNEGVFLKNVLEMIAFGKYSINGYLAVVALHLFFIQLGNEKLTKIDNIILRISQNPIESNHFFLCILLDNLLKTKGQNSAFYHHILEHVRKIINPLIKEGTIDFNPFFYLDNDFFNKNSNEPIYNQLVSQFFSISSKSVLDNILPKLNYISFLENKLPSRYIAKKFIDSDHLNNDSWNQSLMTFLATCYENDKEFITSLIGQLGAKLKINEWQLINKANKNISSLNLPRSYQSKWNEFIVNGIIHNKRIRYFLIKDLIGGLIQSNTVPNFSKEFRKFIIELTKSYFEENIVYFDDLNEHKIFFSTISKKDSSKTELYIKNE